MQKKFGLPTDGISDELDEYIEYIEIVSVPAKKTDKSYAKYPKQDCVLNIVANEKHDIPLVERFSSINSITLEQRIENQETAINYRMKLIDKPLQFLKNNNKYDSSYKFLYAYDFIHSADVIPDYDYFSKEDFRCLTYLNSLRYNTDIKFHGYLRNSVIKERAIDDFDKLTRNEVRYINYRKDEDSIFINLTIPKTVVIRFYDETEIPPEPTDSMINTILEIPKLIAVLPFALLVGLATTEVNTDENRLSKIGIAGKWPKNTPTHFKLKNTSDANK